MKREELILFVLLGSGWCCRCWGEYFGQQWAEVFAGGCLGQVTWAGAGLSSIGSWCWEHWHAAQWGSNTCALPYGRQWGERGNGNPACCSQSQEGKADLSPKENEKWVGMMASDNHGTVLLEWLQVGKTELISTKLRRAADSPSCWNYCFSCSYSVSSAVLFVQQ